MTSWPRCWRRPAAKGRARDPNAAPYEGSRCTGSRRPRPYRAVRSLARPQRGRGPGRARRGTSGRKPAVGRLATRVHPLAAPPLMSGPRVPGGGSGPARTSAAGTSTCPPAQRARPRQVTHPQCDLGRGPTGPPSSRQRARQPHRESAAAPAASPRRSGPQRPAERPHPTTAAAGRAHGEPPADAQRSGPTRHHAHRNSADHPQGKIISLPV